MEEGIRNGATILTPLMMNTRESWHLLAVIRRESHTLDPDDPEHLPSPSNPSLRQSQCGRLLLEVSAEGADAQ